MSPPANKSQGWPANREYLTISQNIWALPISLRKEAQNRAKRTVVNASQPFCPPVLSMKSTGRKCPPCSQNLTFRDSDGKRGAYLLKICDFLELSHRAK